MKKISVVIPNFTQYPLVTNLPAVIKACAGAEIIVVDDASPDNAAVRIKQKFPGIKIIANKVNERFAAACNRGFRAASGEVVVLLNSDVIPRPGFLAPLLKHFADSQVFAVSSLEIDMAGKFSGRNRCWFKRGFLVHSAAPITAGENCWATGGSSAFDRKKYLDIGGMDAMFKPAYWEDIDLSWRARLKGWRILFEPKSRVDHNHETTNINVFGQRRIELIAWRNQILFVWKNIRGLNLWQHFLWLPYHLIITNYRSKGLFLEALFQAAIVWLKK